MEPHLHFKYISLVLSLFHEEIVNRLSKEMSCVLCRLFVCELLRLRRSVTSFNRRICPLCRPNGD